MAAAQRGIKRKRVHPTGSSDPAALPEATQASESLEAALTSLQLTDAQWQVLIDWSQPDPEDFEADLADDAVLAIVNADDNFLKALLNFFYHQPEQHPGEKREHNPVYLSLRGKAFDNEKIRALVEYASFRSEMAKAAKIPFTIRSSVYGAPAAAGAAGAGAYAIAPAYDSPAASTSESQDDGYGGDASDSDAEL